MLANQPGVRHNGAFESILAILDPRHLRLMHGLRLKEKCDQVAQRGSLGFRGLYLGVSRKGLEYFVVYNYGLALSYGRPKS